MNLDDYEINRTLFDEKTKNQFASDDIQCFVCPTCKWLFIACDTCHVYFINNNDLSQTKSFHPLDRPKCHNCNQRWNEVSLIDPSIEDIEKSEWSWLIKRANQALKVGLANAHFQFLYEGSKTF